MSMFWSGSSSLYIHETPENLCSSFKEDKYPYNCLPRRFSPDEPDNRGFRNGRGTLIFLFHRLGFVINLKKSVLTPIQLIEFLGLMIDSVTMTLSLPEEKVVNLRQKCQNLIQNPQTTVGEIASLIGSLCSTAQAVLPAFLQMRYIQQQHISALKQSQNPQKSFFLNEDSIKELDWWVRDLKLSHGKAMITSGIRVVIQTDTSKKG